MAVRGQDGEMPTVEERVAYLEGRGSEHAAAIAEVRADVRDVRQDVRDLRAEMIRRFEQMDGRFEGRFAQIDSRFAHMDNKFNWLVGLQVATLLALIGLLGSHFR